MVAQGGDTRRRGGQVDRETLEEDPLAREAILLRVEIDDRAEMGDRA